LPPFDVSAPALLHPFNILYFNRQFTGQTYKNLYKKKFAVAVKGFFSGF
jgi:hypothetical protein